MSEGDEKFVAVVADFAALRLAQFAGLRAGTTRAHVAAATGRLHAEGFGGGEAPLWMTVHTLAPQLRLTAWYLLSESDPEETVGPEHPVAWIERPITPDDVAGLLQAAGSHCPAGRDHLRAWPARGLGVRYSRRSGLPTILFAFVPCTPAAFDASPPAWQ